MTLGQVLKARRNELGKSIDQVAASTKIHAKTLSAIENDQYTELPARTFTRGFIVNYIKALKLDPEALLKEHHDFLEQKFGDRPSRDQGHQGYAFEGKELEQNKRWLVIGGSLAVVFAVAVLLVFKPQNHKHKEKNKEFESEMASNAEDQEPDVSAVMPPTLLATASPVNSPGLGSSSSSGVMAGPSVSSHLAPSGHAFASASPIPSSSASATPSPSPSPSASPSGKPDKLGKGDDLSSDEAKKKITIQALEDVYVRYLSDARPRGTLILRKGRFLVIRAKDKLLFEVNHPESVSIKTGKQYVPLNQGKSEVTASGVSAYSGAEMGSSSLPEQVPQSPNQ